MYTTSIAGLRALSEATFELSLNKPPSFDFTPGQYVTLAFSGLSRDYTMASGPAAGTLDFCIRKTGGSFTSALSGAEVGTAIDLAGPGGYFTYRSSGRRAVLVATGTGIAPFVSYARAGVAGYVLLHGVRTAVELYYRDILASAASLYVPCISGARRGRFEAGAPGPASHAYSGRVTGYIADLLEPGVYDFYLCGRSDMIVDAVKIIDERFPGSFVYTEPFF